MKEVRLLMGMPIEIEIVGGTREIVEAAFVYLTAVDERFSTYKETSEISRLNRGELTLSDVSSEMQEVFALADKTKAESEGYFDIRQPDGRLDPSGVVKGWAIKKAAALIAKAGYDNYFVNAGGDIASSGKSADGGEWSVGVRNPFNQKEIVKVLYPKGRGVATSGSYVRGAHIYNPHNPSEELVEVVSLTVIGPDVLEADRFATAAFAMGTGGVQFIEAREGLEGYSIDKNGVATLTSGFKTYTSV